MPIEFRMQQYPAMECIRGSVSPSYHRLIVSGQPDLGALLSNRNQTLSVGTKRDNEISEKILNGPQLSREENESDVDMVVLLYFNIPTDSHEILTNSLFWFQLLEISTKWWFSNL